MRRVERLFRSSARRAGRAPLGGEAVWARRFSAVAALCVSAAVVAALPVHADSESSVVDEGVGRLATADDSADVSLRILDSEYELLPVARIYRQGDKKSEFKAAVPTGAYFARVDVAANSSPTPSIVYSVEAQPDKSSYQICYFRRSDCQDVGIDVDLDSGHLFLYVDLTSHRYTNFVKGNVEDFVAQPVELAAHDPASHRKVYRDVMVKPPSGVPDCSDYEAATPPLFGCLLLREILPDEPPATTAAMREALPDLLVQPKENYSLVFGEEFDDASVDSSTGDCMTGMIGIIDVVSFGDNPCTNTDVRGVPCQAVTNGYFYSTKATGCVSSVYSEGKVEFKHGYFEIQYEVERKTLSGYINHAVVVGTHVPDLRHNLRKYGITIESEEDLLRYMETEIDVVEFLPGSGGSSSVSSPLYEISHEIYNFARRLDDHEMMRTTRYIDFCATSNDNTYGAIPITIPNCSNSTKTFVVTRGMEWTPEGIVHYVKVKDDPIYGSEMLPFRDSHTELSYGRFYIYDHGLICGTDRDLFLDPVDPDSSDSDPVIRSTVGVAQIPLGFGIVTHGNSPPRLVRTKFRVHYVRIFQPDNRYSDIEPVYTPLPISEGEVLPSYRRPPCRPFNV